MINSSLMNSEILVMDEFSSHILLIGFPEKSVMPTVPFKEPKINPSPTEFGIALVK